VWGQMILYLPQSGLVCHVLNENICQWCALGISGIHSVLLDCRGRVKGEVEVSG